MKSILLAMAIGLGGSPDLPVEIPADATVGKQIVVNWVKGSWTCEVPHTTVETVVSIAKTRFGKLVCVSDALDGVCFNVDL